MQQRHANPEAAIAILEFWYDFASTYSYPAAMAVEKRADAAGLDIAWRPFLLGPLFAAQGWDNSPFNIYPRKGAYMWRDMARLCAVDGLEFHRPAVFPQRALLASRLALTASVAPHIAAFTRRVYGAQFAEGRDIADPAEISRVLNAMGLDAAAALAQTQQPALKEALKRQTSEAEDKGLFGAPSFLAPDGELFWGYDRLDQAIAWAASPIEKQN